jgi:hypothetical protein
MNDTSITHRISELVDEEHRLRAQLQEGAISADEEHARLRALEEELDQSWDLLRRRRAAREAHQNPDEVEARPVSEVETYLQ